MDADVGIVGQCENGYFMMAHRIDEDLEKLAQEMYSMSTDRGKRSGWSLRYEAEWPEEKLFCSLSPPNIGAIWATVSTPTLLDAGMVSRFRDYLVRTVQEQAYTAFMD